MYKKSIISHSLQLLKYFDIPNCEAYAQSLPTISKDLTKMQINSF